MFNLSTTIFQLCWDGSSCVEPVLNSRWSILLNETKQWLYWHLPCILSSLISLAASIPFSNETPPLTPLKEMFDIHESMTLFISESWYVNWSSDFRWPVNIKKWWSIQPIGCHVWTDSSTFGRLQIFENKKSMQASNCHMWIDSVTFGDLQI